MLPAAQTLISLSAAATLSVLVVYLLRRPRQRKRGQPKMISAHWVEYHGHSQHLLITRRSLPCDLELGPTMGDGTFGEVYRGRWKGALVAVKVVHHQHAESQSYLAAATETLIALAAVHPNVVTTYTVVTEDIGAHYCNDMKGAPCLRSSIAMELCDAGSLLRLCDRFWEVIRRDLNIGLRWVLRTLLEVVHGMEYLHCNGIIHGDLKCANIFCSSQRLDLRGFVCKVGDFGRSRTRHGFQESLSASPGTAIYAAPEVLAGGSCSFQSDVYAFGVTAWHLISLGSLDAAMLDSQVMYQVCEKGWRPHLPGTLPEKLREVVVQCWDKNSRNRPSFAELRAPLRAVLNQVQRDGYGRGQSI